MLKKTLLILTALLGIGACQSSFHEKDKLPFHSQAYQGQLQNGLRYVILPNHFPQNRVYMRLVINAGSMHEDDDQKGVAHIVEHMAFNGSQQYPQNQIINALERLGMKFARDINAFTDFENTVYVLNIAKNDQESLSLALNVIDQWLNHLTILPADLDAERGIVLEEWRSRLSPMLRLGDKKSQIEMAGSRYVERDPIGDVNVIKNVSAQRVKDFYQKWYRPDNVSLVIVGDVNPLKIESLIQQQLASKNPLQSQPLPKINFDIPLPQQWRLATVFEAEMREPSLELSFLKPAETVNTVAQYRENLWQQIVIRLLNLRLQQWEKYLQQSSSAVIKSANFYHEHLGKQTLQSTFSLQLENTDYQKATEQLFNFIAEIAQNGFTQAELDEERQRLHKLNAKQRHLEVSSIKIADELVVTVANDQVLLSPQDQYELNNNLLNQLNLSEINRTFQQMLQLKAKLMLITQPNPHKLSFDSKWLEQKWQQSLQQNQSSWQQDNKQVQLPQLDLVAGSLTKQKVWRGQKITEYQLSNGSKLVYMYSDKNPNQVYFKALTAGGLRSIPKQQYHPLRAAISVVDDTGIGIVPQADINQYFSHSPIAFTTVIDDAHQGFTAAGKTESLADILRLFRLKLQASPVSAKALADYRKSLREEISEKSPEQAFMQKVEQLRFPQQETIYGANRINNLNLSADQLSALYQQYIADKTDFTYFIVGDINESAVQNLAEKYLANLPVKKQNRALQPIKAHVPSKNLVFKGLHEPRAEVEIYFAADHQWRVENEYLLDILADIIQEKLRLSLREQASGIYSVNAWFEQPHFSPQIEGKIEFSCEPERAKELTQLTHRVLDQMLKQGIEPELLAKKVSEKQSQLKQAKESLLAIFSQLEQSYSLTDSPSLMFLDQQLKQFATQQNIEALAEKILSSQFRFEAMLTQ
ncbi:peptidase M16 [Canicola haemoglobinophilus]|uniref:Zinc protease n=1 Tax=Canicola haemoglobinophilus TaxID=733 RepID=A0A1V4B394_9PAST|nr:insulinase family protein [Canicola haemoglobinophilus]OOS01779.1 peptidase M16 [Canicola haemoglobinophilus]STO60668.1 zinc protease [Canicola haemoglobinophilus]